METLERAGNWWLPDNPDQKIAGRLTFDPKTKATLHLFGGFEGAETPFWSDTVFECPIILGDTTTGEAVTLYNSFQTSGNQKESSFFCSEIIIGNSHFDKEETLTFSKYQVNYAFMNEWSKPSGLDYKPGPDGPVEDFTVSYKRPEEICVTTPGFDLRFKYAPALSFDVNGMSFSQDTRIMIEHEDDVALRLLKSEARQIQNFLTLGMGTPTFPVRVIAMRKDGSSPYNIYFCPMAYGQYEKLSHRKVLFRIGDIQTDLANFLNQWLVKAENLKPVMDLYFGVLRNPSMYLDSKFLSLAQAIEVFHRRTHDRPLLPKREFKHFRNSLNNFICQTCNDLKESTAHANNDAEISAEQIDAFCETRLQGLHFQNEMSLRLRLEDLISTYGRLIDFMLPDEDDFIRSVVATRNYMTHYNRALKRKAKEGGELLYLVERLKALIAVCFLAEIGMPQEKIKELASSNGEFTGWAKRFKHLK